MQLFNIVLLFSLLQAVIASNSIRQINYNHGLRNLKFKFVILKDKEYPKLIKYIKNKYKLFYEKAIATIGEGMMEYENLSYEDKEIIDLLIATMIGY
jgi:hypothetical protein